MTTAIENRTASIMKKHIIRTILVISLLVGVFGAAAVKSHFYTVRGGIRETIREAVPAEYEIKRIRSLIDAMSEDVFAFQEKVVEIEATVKAKRAETERLKQSVAADLRDLVTEKNMLSREGDEFVVHGVSYRRAGVETSAKARMARIKRDEATLALLLKAIAPLERDVADAGRRLAEAASLRDDKLRELDLLVAGLKNAELRGDLAELSTPLKEGVVSRSQSELADSLKAFSHRVRCEQRRVESTTGITPPALIVHTPASRPGVVEELDDFLSAKQREAGLE